MVVTVVGWMGEMRRLRMLMMRFGVRWEGGWLCLVLGLGSSGGGGGWRRRRSVWGGSLARW